MEPIKQPVQDWWTLQLTWKMQTVLIQSLRAPDTHFCKNIKNLSRWMRSIVLNNADKTHSFMCRKKKLPKWNDLENELNYCSVHFFTHFLYGLEIIGYKHPDDEIRKTAFEYYESFVHYMSHFNVEEEEQLDIRLSDMEDVPTLDAVYEKRLKNVQICPKNDPYVYNP